MYVIDSKVLAKNGLFVEEVLAVLLVKHCSNLKLLFDRLIENHLIVKNSDMEHSYFVPIEIQDQLDDILSKCSPKTSADDVLEALARQMMQVFPAGIKPGTRYPWRGNVTDITKRLRKFQERYPKYSVSDILGATKKYVQSFNGNYDFMRILKYFIWKDDIKQDEDGRGYTASCSDLADFIENGENIGNLFSNQDFATLV